MKTNIGFLIGKESGKAYIELDKKYFPIILETENVLKKLLKLTPEEQQVAKLVFVNLLRNAGK